MDLVKVVESENLRNSYSEVEIGDLSCQASRLCRIDADA